MSARTVWLMWLVSEDASYVPYTSKYCTVFMDQGHESRREVARSRCESNDANNRLAL